MEAPVESVLLEDPKFWVSVAFLLFCALVAKPVGRLILGALDGRGERIRKELADATRLKDEARALLDSYTKQREKVLAEAEHMIAAAQTEAARITRAAEQDAEALIGKRTELVMQRLAQAETQAITDLRNDTIDIAIGAARAVVKEQLDQGKSAELAQLALKDAERKLH